MALNEKLAVVSRLLDESNPEVEERIDRGIQANRMGWGRIRLKRKDGKPVPSAKLKIRQKSHEFLFGCNIFKLGCYDSPEKNRLYEERFRQIFNLAVVPFFWDTLEPEQGKPRFSADSSFIDRRPPPDVVVDWCEENGVQPKGHYLLWHAFSPKWLPDNRKEIERFVRIRFERIAERYSERIKIWDVVNESMVRSWTNAKDAMIRDHVYRAFVLADRLFPMDTQLIYNDVTERCWNDFHWDSSPYYLLLQNLLLRGARLGAAGMQFHMWRDREYMEKQASSYLDPGKIFAVMDQYAELGLPLHVSEVSIPTFCEDVSRAEGLEFQRRLLIKLYRIWFSHAATESIVYWNLPENGGHSENSRWFGLLDEEMNAKPSYQAFDELVNRQWNTQVEVEAGVDGVAFWNGFYGEYNVEIVSGGDNSNRCLKLSRDSTNEYEFVLDD